MTTVKMDMVDVLKFVKRGIQNGAYGAACLLLEQCIDETKKHFDKKTPIPIGSATAMLADVCEALFGVDANGKPFGVCVPELLALNHAGWACAIRPDVNPSSWLKSWTITNDGVTQEQVKEWENMIGALAARVSSGMPGKIKASNVYYQDIVYAICNAIDTWQRAMGINKSIGCGSSTAPNKNVQTAIGDLIRKCKREYKANGQLRQRLEEVQKMYDREANVAVEQRSTIHLYKTTIDVLEELKHKTEGFLEHEGYRRCNAPACNCNSWHKASPTNLSLEHEPDGSPS